MHPTLFAIGKWNIPTYTILLDLGLILGLVAIYFEGKRRWGRGELTLEAGLWSVVGGILGGRLGYVLANWSIFREDWGRVVRIWEGGLSFHGAFLGGVLALGLFALFQRRQEGSLSFWDLADTLTLGLAVGLVFGWAAALMHGSAYGAVGEGFGYAILPNLDGLEASRFATQVVGMAYGLVLFVGFWLLREYWPFPGAASLMFALVYFAGMFFLEFTRGDEAIYLGPWRLPQVVDLALVLVAAGLLMALWWRSRQRAAEPEGPNAAEEIQDSTVEDPDSRE